LGPCCLAGIVALSALTIAAPQQARESRAVYSFDDRPTGYDGGHSDWFKQSFLDLNEDLREERTTRKQ